MELPALDKTESRTWVLDLSVLWVPPASLKVHNLHYDSLLVLHILWRWVTVWWHVSIIMVSYRGFSLPSKSLCSTYHPSCPQRLTTTDVLIVSIPGLWISLSWPTLDFKTSESGQETKDPAEGGERKVRRRGPQTAVFKALPPLTSCITLATD